MKSQIKLSILILCLFTSLPFLQSQNLITNSGFEGGVVSPWYAWSATLEVATDNPYSGTYCLRTTNRAHSYDTPVHNLISLLQDGNYYQFTTWVRTQGEAESKVEMVVSQEDEVVDTHYYLNKRYILEGEWVQLIGFFQLEQHGALDKLRFYVQGPSAGVDIYIDDVVVEQINGDWLAEANAGIEEHRKRDVTVRIVDQNGDPVIGAEVNLQQKSHHFQFGACINNLLVENTDYKDFFINHYEWGVHENYAKWRKMEKYRDELNYTKVGAQYDTCIANGIKMRGHNVFWCFEQYLPDWAQGSNLTDAELGAEMVERITDAVGYFAQDGRKMYHWDVNNEMLHGSYFKDRLGDTIRSWMFRQANLADPDARLFVNDYNILAGRYPQEFVKQIEELQSQGAPIHGIGVQTHMHDKVNPYAIKHSLDILSETGLPVLSTEFDIEFLDENIRANRLERFFRVIFGHPNTTGIFMWGFWEDSHWKNIQYGPVAHIVDSDWSLNAAGIKYEELIEEWTTDTTIVSGINGELNCRVFHGGFDITVSPADGSEYTIDQSILPGDDGLLITVSPPVLFISEIADPLDNPNARFIELYNSDTSIVDFDTDTWFLGCQADNATWHDIQLSGSVAPKQTYVIAYGADFSNFKTAYGFDPDLASLHISGDGNDGYYLYKSGNHSRGVLIDSYGIIGTNGTGEAWEYSGSKAVRETSVARSNITWTSSEWAITSATASATGPASHSDFTTWSGKNSEAWNTTTNWSGGAMPSSETNIKIPASASNFPSISAAATCNNVLIGPGASLVGVDNLTVSGTAVVNQEISGYSSDDDGWHLIGCPMSDMAIAGSGFVSGTYDFYRYSEETDTWLNQEDPANEALFGNFLPGIGYLASYETASTKSFSGSLNNANVTVSGLTKTNEGWHSLSNPFPSGLDWATGWTLSNVGATAQILKADGTGYRVLTAGDDIPASQGFWVQVSTAPASVTVPVSAATHSSEAFSTKSAQPDDLTLRLYLDSIRNVETRIIFNKNAGDGFDWGYDAHYLPPLGNDIPQLYSLISEEKVALNSFNFINNKSIALGTEVQKTGTFQLYADGLSSFSNNVSIILEDTRNKTFFDFRKQNPVNVEILPGDKHGRYLLHFATNDPGFADIQVYSYANCIYINNTGNEALRADISICNILGQDIWHKEMYLTGMQMFTLNVAKSIIIVKINTGNKIVTRKVFIN